MTTLPRTESRRTRRRRGDSRVVELAERLEATERDVERLRYALDAVAREQGLSVTVPCRCGRGLLLSRGGELTCPCCGYRRTV